MLNHREGVNVDNIFLVGIILLFVLTLNAMLLSARILLICLNHFMLSEDLNLKDFRLLSNSHPSKIQMQLLS